MNFENAASHASLTMLSGRYFKHADPYSRGAVENQGGTSVHISHTSQQVVGAHES